MAYQVELHPLAEVELWEAVDWYDAQMPDLGKNFAREIQGLVASIQANPHAFPKAYKTYRKALLPKFPFILIFEIIQETVLIMAVFHTSRNPKAWQKR